MYYFFEIFFVAIQWYLGFWKFVIFDIAIIGFFIFKRSLSKTIILPSLYYFGTGILGINFLELILFAKADWKFILSFNQDKLYPLILFSNGRMLAFMVSFPFCFNFGLIDICSSLTTRSIKANTTLYCPLTLLLIIQFLCKNHPRNCILRYIK